MTTKPATPTFSTQFYPFLHDQGESLLADVLAGVETSTLQKCADVMELRAAVLERCADDMVSCAMAMATAFRNGGKLLAFGNGGSATDAQDIAVDCTLRGLPALSLTNDAAVITAVGNDVGFENIFMRQIISLGRPGDIALGVSTSGNSSNIESAFVTAHRMGLLGVGLAGYEGGRTAELHRVGIVEFCFVAPSSYIPRIQEAHATIYHTLVELAYGLREGALEGP